MFVLVEILCDVMVHEFLQVCCAFLNPSMLPLTINLSH